MGKIFKKTVCILIIIIAVCYIPVFCDDGDDSESIMMKQLENLDMESMQQFVDAINRESNGYLPDLNIKDMVIGLFKKDAAANMRDIASGLLKYLWKEVLLNIDLLGKIVIISVICALLQNLHKAFEKDTVGKLAYSMCYLLIIIMAVQSFNAAVHYGTGAIDSMVSFLQALLPTLLALLAAVGGITSATVFQPIIFTAISFITSFIKTFIIPLVFLSAVLSILNNISDSINISKLASLLKQTAIGLLGLMLTVFLGFISVQGIAASSLDSVTAQSAKFAVDNFIPIIGGFLSDAFDTVISCSLLLKNGIGIAGLIILLLICAFPLIKMFSIIVIYKVSCALIQPILDNQIVQCLSDMSNSLVVLLCCVIAVGVMFFMAITIIMGVGNMTVMMR